MLAIAPFVFFATGFWNATTYDPVTGRESNPQEVTKTVVQTVEDPTTEVDIRQILLDPRINAQIGDEVTLTLQPAKCAGAVHPAHIPPPEGEQKRDADDQGGG